jgi:hypothetical protein
MKSLIRISAFVLFLLPVMVSAQEPQHPLAGGWKGAMEEGAAEVDEVFVELRIQGDAVTGPVIKVPFERYIKQGTATANSVTFTTSGLKEDDADVTLVWTGQLTGNNELAFTVEREDHQGEAKEFVLTKREATPPGGGR